MKKSIQETYPSALPTERKDNFRQDHEDKVRKRWTALAGLGLAGLVGLIYSLGGEVIASTLVAVICFQLVAWSLWILPRNPVILRDHDGQRYQLHDQQDLRRYASKMFIGIIVLLVPAIFILSMDGGNTGFNITFVLGMLACSLAERYRIVRSKLD
jgi:hypothetical protein